MLYIQICHQVKLLRLLALLGAGDKAGSDNMYAVVGDVMRRANTGHTIGNAIVYECVRTITAIYPNPVLLQSGVLPPLPYLPYSVLYLPAESNDSLSAPACQTAFMATVIRLINVQPRRRLLPSSSPAATTSSMWALTHSPASCASTQSMRPSTSWRSSTAWRILMTR